tara:strand:- start:5497 stop:6000 length:504 start_codon:yes stop_codon:yes gene_type:complete
MRFTFPTLIIVSTISAFLYSCATQGESSQNTTNEITESYYGSVIETSGAIDASTIREKLSEESQVSVKMEGTVVATCGKKGCWMDVASGKDTVFVKFLDYEFFVPTEGVEGYHTVVEGVAFYDTTTVAALRHFAEDAGKSEEEILAITEPEYRLQFTATGVMMEAAK